MYINTYNIFMHKLFCYKLDQILFVIRFKLVEYRYLTNNLVQRDQMNYFEMSFLF